MAAQQSNSQSPEAAPRRRSGWILDPRRDLLLFVATPLLILPLAWLAQQRYSGEQILTLVLAFGALGHHVPGMMRAYGDRELFRRFRWRFVLVPLILLPICAFFAFDQLVGMKLVVLAWGVWHFLMQTYGFARIYDAKLGQVDALSRRLDWLLCIGWFGMAILHSPRRIGEFLEMAYQAGLPTDWSMPLKEACWGWTAATLVVTAWAVMRLVLRHMQGLPVSGAKLALLVISFSFFWFCTAHLSNLVLGVAMFEVFHDVQYLAIVWIFNRNRVKSGANVGSLTRFLFRNSGALMGLYLGVVFAYGSLSIVVERVSTQTLQNLLYGVIVTSNLLHFYYDGFIWKVRESSTRRSLGVRDGAGGDKGGSGPPEARGTQWVEVRHWLAWGGLAAVAGILALSEGLRTADETEMAAAVVDVVPESVRARNVLAKRLIDENRFEEAIGHATVAIGIEPDVFKSYVYRGVARVRLGRVESGLKDLVTAERLYAGDPYLQLNLGLVKRDLGRTVEAVRHFEALLVLQPTNPVVHFNLGAICYEEARETSDRPGLELARRHFQQAAKRDPQHAGPACMLGAIENVLGNPEGALSHFLLSLSLDPLYADAHHGRSLALRDLTRFDEANAALATAAFLAVRESPQNARMGRRALEWAEELRVRSRRDDPLAWEMQGLAHAVNEQWGLAVEAADRAIAAATGPAGNGGTKNPGLAERVRRQREHYRQQRLPILEDLQPPPSAASVAPGSATNR